MTSPRKDFACTNSSIDFVTRPIFVISMPRSLRSVTLNTSKSLSLSSTTARAYKLALRNIITWRSIISHFLKSDTSWMQLVYFENITITQLKLTYGHSRKGKSRKWITETGWQTSQCWKPKFVQIETGKWLQCIHLTRLSMVHGEHPICWLNLKLP